MMREDAVCFESARSSRRTAKITIFPKRCSCHEMFDQSYDHHSRDVVYMVPGQPHSPVMKTEKAKTIEVGSFVTVIFFLLRATGKTHVYYTWAFLEERCSNWVLAPLGIHYDT
jgi:hypothetical protein